MLSRRVARSLGYTYPCSSLTTGSSLGNLQVFARLDAQTNLRGLWSSADNQFYVGEWTIDILVDGHPLMAQHTVFRPESQATILVREAHQAEKQFFVPYAFSPGEHPSVLRIAVFVLRLANRAATRCEFSIRHAIIFPAVPTDLFAKQPPADQVAKRVRIVTADRMGEIVTVGNEREARVVALEPGAQHIRTDDSSLLAESMHAVDAGEVLELTALLAFSPDGLDNAREGLDLCRDVDAVHEKTVKEFDRLIETTAIVTPDAVINRGIQWAKVNMARVQHQYRTGLAFTNDPPQDIVVIRDVAWYVCGADYLTPQFSHEVLSLCERHGFHEGGKLAEFIHADEHPPLLHDYGLNINDDTPLFVIAAYHHACICEDGVCLQRIYPSMKRACDWILSQMRSGLVWCTATGTNVRGICSWRNIIDGYTLSGGVTEINSECLAALRFTSQAARRLGMREDAEKLENAADNLKRSIDEILISEKTGLYLLNVGLDGTRHHDVTGDLIFPVVFGVAEGQLREGILDRLTAEDMWTPFGARTVSPSENNYDPDLGYQLLGGVWPNLTSWISYCIRERDPDELVKAMRNIYSYCEAPVPRDNLHLVPGQFPERIHGTTFQSKGMTLSPWMPPTYLWLAVEGLLGVRATFEHLEIQPFLPADWDWIVIKDLPYKGRMVSALLVDGVLYTTEPVKSFYEVVVAQWLDVQSDTGEFRCVALEEKEQVLLFVAATEGATGTVSVRGSGVALKKTLSLEAGEGRLMRFKKASLALSDHRELS